MRFGFFSLLAYDLWTIGLSHAPRYGVTSFNVTHIAWLDQLAPTPSPSSIGALYISTGALALLIAVGLVGRMGIILCALMYSVSYFWSQADSYQHHYLLCLCLWLFTAAPWRAPQSKDRLWLKALMIQLALIYGWTALAKVDDAWLTGETLRDTIASSDTRALIESTFSGVITSSIGQWVTSMFGLNLQVTDVYALGAKAVMLGEWFAAIAFLLPPLRWVAFLIVPWFHIGVEWVGFDIELFSYYMILLNLTLLSPSWLWRPFERLLPSGPDHPHPPSPQKNWAVQWGSALGYGVTIALLINTINLEGAMSATVLSLIVVTLSVGLKSSAGQTTLSLRSKSVLCCSIALVYSGLWIGVQHVNSSSFRFDYYRMWGGDLKRRGQLERAYEVYQLANRAQEPDLPARFMKAGEVALELGRIDEAIEALNEGCRRRLMALESASISFTRAHESQAGDTDSAQQSSRDLREERRGFYRAARSAQKAHQKLFQVYRQRRDPRAQEIQYALEGVREIISQTEAITR